jgi:hypothetical protein
MVIGGGGGGDSYIAYKRRDGVDEKTLMRLPVVDFYWKVAERNNIIGTR